MRYSVLIFLLWCVKLPFSQHQELHSRCQLNNAAEGICLQFEFCKSAKLNLEKHISPTLCGYPDFYVCCEKSAQLEGGTVSSDQGSSLKSGNLMSQVLELTNCNSGRRYAEFKSDHIEFSYGSQEESSKSTAISNHLQFMAKIGIRLSGGDSKFYCGGLLLTDLYVVMPAHCARYKGQAPEIVQLGINIQGEGLDDTFEKIPISEIHVHPDYISTQMYHDIALVELVVPSTFLPSCLWRWNQEEIMKNTTFVLGHDLQKLGNLLSMEAEVLELKGCNEVYQHISTLPNGTLDTQFCMGRSNVTDGSICKGFIGGSLFAQTIDGEYFLIGLANYVQQCYSQRYPMIFTNLLVYKKWLESVIFRVTHA